MRKLHCVHIYLFRFYDLECILGTNININENLALHEFLFIPLYIKNAKNQKNQGKRDFHFGSNVLIKNCSRVSLFCHA